MKTAIAKPQQIQPHWYLVDATNKVLGRLASQIAARLRGKYNTLFTPHALTGEHIIVTNVAKIAVTGKKATDKLYVHYTGYPGGLKAERYDHLQKRFPERILKKAVKGMLPKGPLGRLALKRLKIYANAEHPHSAQQPQVLKIT